MTHIAEGSGGVHQRTWITKCFVTLSKHSCRLIKRYCQCRLIAGMPIDLKSINFNAVPAKIENKTIQTNTRRDIMVRNISKVPGC